MTASNPAEPAIPRPRQGRERSAFPRDSDLDSCLRDSSEQHQVEPAGGLSPQRGYRRWGPSPGAPDESRLARRTRDIPYIQLVRCQGPGASLISTATLPPSSKVRHACSRG
jgi:hypothetical protein